MFSSKILISFRLKKDMDILDDMWVNKLSAKTFFESELILQHILFTCYPSHHVHSLLSSAIF